MARLRLHRLRLHGLCLGRPIPEPRQRRSRRALPHTYRGLCMGRLGDGQTKGRARIARLSSLQRLFRGDTNTRTTLHALRRCTPG